MHAFKSPLKFVSAALLATAVLFTSEAHAMTCTYNGRWANNVMSFVWVFAFFIGGYFIFRFWKKKKKAYMTIFQSIMLLIFIPFVLHPVVNIIIVRPIYVHFEKKSDKACSESYKRWEKGNPGNLGTQYLLKSESGKLC